MSSSAGWCTAQAEGEECLNGNCSTGNCCLGPRRGHSRRNLACYWNGVAGRKIRVLVHTFYLGFLFIAIVTFGVIIAREEGALGELQAQADARMQVTRQAAKLLVTYHDYHRNNCAGFVLGDLAFSRNGSLEAPSHQMLQKIWLGAMHGSFLLPNRRPIQERRWPA